MLEDHLCSIVVSLCYVRSASDESILNWCYISLQLEVQNMIKIKRIQENENKFNGTLHRGHCVNISMEHIIGCECL